MGKAMSGSGGSGYCRRSFAEGFKALGMLDAIVGLATDFGFGALGMSIMFVVITVLVTIINAGSNGASFYPIVEMIPKLQKTWV